MSSLNSRTDINIAGLGDLGLNQLRQEWRNRCGPPPKIRSPELLALMLAYRIQVAEEGGVDVEMRRTLRRPPASKGVSLLTQGALLSREWKGVRHEVTVETAGQIRWQGQNYKSLSEVARAITGSRWNGPRFFGLRNGPS